MNCYSKLIVTCGFVRGRITLAQEILKCNYLEIVFRVIDQIEFQLTRSLVGLLVVGSNMDGLMHVKQLPSLRRNLL